MSDTNASISAMMKKLKEGSSVSRSTRVPIADAVAISKVTSTLAKMRNSLNQIAVRTKEITGRSYTVETGQFVNHTGTALILTAVATCMEDEGEDDI